LKIRLKLPSERGHIIALNIWSELDAKTENRTRLFLLSLHWIYIACW